MVNFPKKKTKKQKEKRNQALYNYRPVFNRNGLTSVFYIQESVWDEYSRLQQDQFL
jgi:hypothetical protein